MQRPFADALGRWPLAFACSVSCLITPAVWAEGTVDMTKRRPARERYEPDWASLDRHPLPEWFDDAKFGMFIHWGPYSSEAGGAHEFMKPELLTAARYDPHEWIRIARDAGMRYITFTTKHGGGYMMFDNPHGQWSAVHSGPKRDLFGEFAEACRAEKMRFLAYYCKDDIFMPSGAPGRVKIKDRKRYNEIVKRYDMQWVIDHWVEYLQDNIKTIARKYKPDGFWFDGVHPKYQYTRMQDVVAWLYNRYPDMVLSDRVGQFTQRKVHGDFLTYERGWIRPVHILPKKWERSTTLGGSWAYKPSLTLDRLQSAEEVIWDVIDNVAKGGNYSLGIGPRADGSIPDYYKIRLAEIGEWFKINGEAVWATRPWIWGYFHEGDRIRYTMSKDGGTVYAIIRGWPGKRLNLEYLHSSVCVVKDVKLLGCDEKIQLGGTKRGGRVVHLPGRKRGPHNIYVLRFRVKREDPA